MQRSRKQVPCLACIYIYIYIYIYILVYFLLIYPVMVVNKISVPRNTFCRSWTRSTQRSFRPSGLNVCTLGSTGLLFTCKLSAGAVHRYYESRRRLFNDSQPTRRQSALKVCQQSKKNERRRRVSGVLMMSCDGLESS